MDLSQIKSRKKLGEWAEMAFMLRATALGFTVSKPFGDTAQYDVMLEKRRTVHRIQVKCTAALLLDAYRVQTRHRATRNGRYHIEDADFLACYVIPEDAWYIIPVAAISHTTGIYLRPHRPRTRARHEFYREAWHLLEPPEDPLPAAPPSAAASPVPQPPPAVRRTQRQDPRRPGRSGSPRAGL